MTITTVFFQMLALLIMIGAGVLATKTKMLNASGNGQLSKMIVVILNPLLVFANAAKAAGTIPPAMLGQVFLVAVGMFAFLIVAAAILSPLFDKDIAQRKIFQLMFIFSNVGFIGIPVVTSVLGAEYVVYVTVFILVYNIIFYTYGVALMDGHFSFSSLKSMCNSGNFFCLAALVVLVWGISLPDFIMTAVTYLGNAASPLALICVGFTLANADLATIFRSPRLYAFTALKLLALPIVMFFILRLCPVDPVLLPVSMVMFGMPVGNMPLILGTQKGLDVSACSASIIMSSVLCVLTVPVLMTFV